jgi:hypothetical protein
MTTTTPKLTTIRRRREAQSNGVRRTPFSLLPALLALVVAGIAPGLLQAAEPAKPQDRAQLEKQLQDARARLDDAARDVAELSNELYGGERTAEIIRLRHGPGGMAPRGAMLGINIGGDQARADGVEVMGVSPSGPAQAAGLRKGDVITAIDGQALRKTDDRSASRQLVEHMRGVEPGKVVKVDYLRDGKKATASITTVAAEPPMMRAMREHLPMLENMELPPHFDMFIPGHGRSFRSLELVSITPKLGQYFGTDKGLLVVRAPTGEGAKLEEGDVILTIGGRTPENPGHAFRILSSYQPEERVKVEVLRQRKRVALDMQVPTGGGMEFPGATPARPPTPPAAPTAPSAAPAAAPAAAVRGAIVSS